VLGVNNRVRGGGLCVSMLLAGGVLCVGEQAVMVRGCEERKSTILGLIGVPCVIRVLCVLGNSRTSHLGFFGFSARSGFSPALSRMEVSIPPSSGGVGHGDGILRV